MVDYNKFTPTSDLRATAAAAKAAPAAETKPPLKPCCACPETKKARDDCMLKYGSEESCRSLIEAHQQCLRNLGFKI
ncbi:cytochrome C oxidase copper chaperone [Ramicandelaber brevisporus]|nr:cytochrome C oxidase copper chaperone [Ramicandelaber brevisporus]